MAFNRGGGRNGRGGARGRARYGIAPGGRIKTSTTNLPAALSEEMESSSSQFFADGDDRNFNKKFKNKAAGRKVRRKQERMEKKKNRTPTLSKVELLARQQHTVVVNQPSDNIEKSKRKGGIKKQRLEVDLNENDGEDREEEKFLRESKKNGANKETPLSSSKIDVKDLDARRLEKLAKSNPAFYAMLQEDGVVAGVSSGFQEGIDEDEQYIRHYEKKLGIKRKDASKLASKKSFLDDGLGDLLEGIELGSRGRVGNAVSKNVTKSAVGSKETKRSSSEKVQDKKRKLSQVESEDEDKLDEDSFDSDLEGIDSESMSGSEVNNDVLSDLDSFDEEFEGVDSEIMDDLPDMDDLTEEGIESFDDELEGLGTDDDSDEDGDDIEGVESEIEISLDEETNDSPDDNVSVQDQKHNPSSTAVVAQSGKYLPPHLRAATALSAAASGASALAKAIPRQNTEELQRLRRQLQGLLNKLSESNIESILMDIEALYRKYPRADVTETITDMILASISSKANLLDSFVILYATVVASLYRLVGIEFAAHFIQTLVEQFDGHHALASSTKSTEMTDETLSVVKQCTNLIVLVSELYNMQVVACVLVYELIRWFMTELSEMNVELVVKIVRTSGYQLRQDDPTTLKTIIQEFTVLANQTSTKGAISSRTRFLLETLTALKANRMKGPASNSTTSGTITESATRMKKFLSGLSKKRTTFPSEPMRVGLTDIRQVGSKGKWWLVGSSWKNNMVGEERVRSSLSTSTADNLLDAEDELVKLARKNKMNTDVRRSIFVVLMSSEDYIDAFERLIKLNLKEVQQREIVRVLLHCAGNEMVHNPYYTLVGQRLCQHDHSFKVTMQYSLWDLLREMGATDVGGMEKVKDGQVIGLDDGVGVQGGKKVALRRIVNLSKMYSFLISSQDLSLVMLKTVTFTSLPTQPTLFFQLLMTNIILSSQPQIHSPLQQHGQKDKETAKEKTKLNAQALADIFIRAAVNPTLAQGIIFFLQAFVKKGQVCQTEREKETVKWGCTTVREPVLMLTRTSASGRHLTDLNLPAPGPTAPTTKPAATPKRLVCANSPGVREYTSKIHSLSTLPTLSPVSTSFTTSPSSNAPAAYLPTTINSSLSITVSSRPSSVRKPVRYGPVSPRTPTSPVDSTKSDAIATENTHFKPLKVQTHSGARILQSDNGRGPHDLEPHKGNLSDPSTKNLDAFKSRGRSNSSIDGDDSAISSQSSNTTNVQSNTEGNRVLRAETTKATHKQLRQGSFPIALPYSNQISRVPQPISDSGHESIGSGASGDSLSLSSSTSLSGISNVGSGMTHLDIQLKKKKGLLSPMTNITQRGSDTSIKNSILEPQSPTLSDAASWRDRPPSSTSLKDGYAEGETTPSTYSPSRAWSRSGNSYNSQQYFWAQDQQQEPPGGRQQGQQQHSYRSNYQTNEREPLPPHNYENEDFALWIRTVTQARQVVSGIDVEDQDELHSSSSSTHSANTATKSGSKKLSPELDDLAILEEILEFYGQRFAALIILMRASASLYPYIYGAHSKMIKVYVPWQRLHPKDRPCDPVRNARDYQSIIMRDIGEAIEIMAEIHEQEVRPFGHPANQGRDVKQRFGPRFGTFVRPLSHVRRSPATPCGPNITSTTSAGDSKKSTIVQLLSTIGITGSSGTDSSKSNGGNDAQKCLTPATRPAIAAEMNISGHSSSSVAPSHAPVVHGRPAPIQTAPIILQTPRQPEQQHRRRSSVNYVKTSMMSFGKNIMKSMPSPKILNSAHFDQQHSQDSTEGNLGLGSFLDDKNTASSTTSGQSMPLPIPIRPNQHLADLYSAVETHTSSRASTTNQTSNSLSIPASIQSLFGFKSPLSSTSHHSQQSHLTTNSDAFDFYSMSPQHSQQYSPAGTVLTRQEEKQLRLEANWRADITHRKAALRAWCCHRFTEMYEFSLSTSWPLEGEFKDLYRIIGSIVDVDRTDRSHEAMAWELERTRSDEQPFKLRYSRYRSTAPTSEEIDLANKLTTKEFEAEFARMEKNDGPKGNSCEDETSLSLKAGIALSTCQLQDHELIHPVISTRLGNQRLYRYNSDGHSPTDDMSSTAYENMEFYHLQEHSLWEPLLDRITKFDSTHHSLDPRNIFRFLRRMSVDEEPLQMMSQAMRNELLAVLWVLERCVRERPDSQQSPTWFRLSSSNSAVMAVYRAGGIIPYLKEMRSQSNNIDPILMVHPVTVTGYFKRLLKDAGGLLLKETTGLFVELVRPTTDNGDFWNLEHLSRIDRALLFRVICLDQRRGEVFIRISRVMAMILERAPEDMELDAFALSKMVQVVELTGVLDWKALKRWNGAWSAIILGYL
ncbi:suppressor of glycerol defect [Podila humilis]|nr:suppressor of glycerol defect [Podila humilis]